MSVQIILTTAVNMLSVSIQQEILSVIVEKDILEMELPVKVFFLEFLKLCIYFIYKHRH